MGNCYAPYISVYRIGKVSDEELLTWLNFQEVHDYVCGIHDGKGLVFIPHLDCI